MISSPLLAFCLLFYRDLHVTDRSVYVLTVLIIGCRIYTQKGTSKKQHPLISKQAGDFRLSETFSQKAQ